MPLPLSQGKPTKRGSPRKIASARCSMKTGMLFRLKIIEDLLSTDEALLRLIPAHMILYHFIRRHILFFLVRQVLGQRQQMNKRIAVRASTWRVIVHKIRASKTLNAFPEFSVVHATKEQTWDQYEDNEPPVGLVKIRLVFSNGGLVRLPAQESYPAALSQPFSHYIP